MKMTSFQYWELTHELDKIEKQYGENEVRKFRHNVKYSKDQFIAFIWAMYWKIPTDVRELIRYDLDDSHIETALKKALRRYK